MRVGVTKGKIRRFELAMRFSDTLLRRMVGLEGVYDHAINIP